MAYPDPAQTSAYEDQLLKLYGYEPETLPAAYQPQEFSHRGNLLESFAGLEGLDLPQPRSFGEGLLYGVTRGLGAGGTKRTQQREKFETAQVNRQATIDAERRRVSQENQKSRREAGKEFRTEQAGQRKEKAKFEQENPVLTDEEAAVNPGFAAAGFKIGQPVSKSFRERLGMYSVEAPERQARDVRAQAIADRQVASAERQTRLAETNTVGKLFDDYRIDPAIKGYQNVRTNLNTAETAAKQQSGPGDIAVVFAFMRALEPDNPNAVREGEYDNARKATGLFQQALNLPSRYFQGNQLTPVGRQFFLSQMRATLKSRRSDYDLANDQFSRRAEQGGVDPSLFIREFQPAGQAPQGGPQPNVKVAPIPKEQLDSEWNRFVRSKGGR